MACTSSPTYLFFFQRYYHHRRYLHAGLLHADKGHLECGAAGSGQRELTVHIGHGTFVRTFNQNRSADDGLALRVYYQPADLHLAILHRPWQPWYGRKEHLSFPPRHKVRQLPETSIR